MKKLLKQKSRFLTNILFAQNYNMLKEQPTEQKLIIYLAQDLINDINTKLNRN